MAVVLPSPLVAMMSGSIGHSTFRRHRGSIIAMPKANCRRARRPLQQTLLAANAYLLSYAKAMSPTNRAKWLALYNELRLSIPEFSKRYSSWLHLFCAQNLQYFFLTRVIFFALPPTYHQLQAPAGPLCINPHPNIVSLLFSTYPLLSGEKMIIFASYKFPHHHLNPRTWNQGRTYYSGPLSTVQYWSHNFNYPLNVDVRFTNLRLSPNYVHPNPTIQRLLIT